MDELKGLERKLKSLKAANERIFGKLATNYFDYSEQAFIRRIIKAVFPQLKSVVDKDTAKSILEKTEWLDEGT